MADFQHSGIMSRRHVFSSALAATVIGANAGTATLPPNDEHDAVLLAAWTGYKAVYAQFNAMPMGKTDEECDRKVAWFENAIAGFENTLRVTEAKTLAGVAARMSYLCCEGQSNKQMQDHLFYGKPLSADFLDDRDYVDELMIRLTLNIRAISA